MALACSACGSVTSNDGGDPDAGSDARAADGAPPDSSGTPDSSGVQHTIFTTSTTTLPSVGLDTFTKICGDLANAAGLGGNFVPLVQLDNQALDAHIQILGPVFNTNGEMVAANADEFFAGNFQATNGFSESGGAPGDTVVYLGDNKNNNCADWSTADPAKSAAQGEADSTTFLTPVSTNACSTQVQRPIMCISQ